MVDESFKNRGIRGAFRDYNNNDAQREFDEFTVLQDVRDTNLDTKIHEINEISSGNEEAIAANPIIAIDQQDEKDGFFQPEVGADTAKTELLNDPPQTKLERAEEADLGQVLPDPLSSLVSSVIEQPSSAQEELLLNNSSFLPLRELSAQDDLAGSRVAENIEDNVNNPFSIQNNGSSVTNNNAQPEESEESENISDDNTSDEDDDSNDGNDDGGGGTRGPSGNGPNTNENEDEGDDTEDDTQANNGNNSNGNNGHGNNEDGVDNDNSGVGSGGPNGLKTSESDDDEGSLGNQGDDDPGADPNTNETEEGGDETGDDTEGNTEDDTQANNGDNSNDNNGHGNNEDGVDNDNPGVGSGGPNELKTSESDDDEGSLGNQGDDDPGADPNIAFFEIDISSEMGNTDSWLTVTDFTSDNSTTSVIIETQSELSWVDEVSQTNMANIQETNLETSTEISGEWGVDLSVSMDLLSNPLSDISGNGS